MRVRTWQSNLQALIAERDRASFAWGKNDCGLFAADAVLAITGNDPAADLRGTYDTEQQANALLEDGIIVVGDARFGERIRPSLAQVGDIGLVDTPNGFAFAVCGGSQWLAPARDGRGLARLPFAAAHLAWRGECRV
jgi:hypothetical protein